MEAKEAGDGKLRFENVLLSNEVKLQSVMPLLAVEPFHGPAMS